MKNLNSLLILGCSLAVLSQLVTGQENAYTFDSDLESLTAGNNIWQWTDRQTLPWLLPEGSDGFAVQYIPGPGDVLYESDVDIQYGFSFEMSYFIANEVADTTVIRLQQLDLDGNVLQEVAVSGSDPSNNVWLTSSGSFGAFGVPSRFGVFCQTASLNFVGSTFYGCAIDSLTLNANPAPTTPEITTAAPTSAVPADLIDYNFEENAQGWLLGNSNGAAWLRRQYTFSEIGIAPPTGDYVLQLQPQDVYSGTALATSPRLRVGDSGEARVRVEFYIAASPEYPAYLKLRRRLSYTTYNDNVFLNMDPFGDQLNLQWLRMEASFQDLVPGDEFNIVLEGNLGITNERNTIFVSRVTLEGLTEVPYQEEEIFDFNEGLVGWQSGSKDGGKWEVVAYADLSPDLNVPAPPTFTPNILIVNRYDIHSGIISIESPPIEIIPGTVKILQIRIFIRGSQVYPVIFRLSLKSLDGVYDPLPFIDLTPQGDGDSQTWVTLGQRVPIPSDPRAQYFQLVFEVDLGGDLDNMIAIDQFEIRTS